MIRLFISPWFPAIVSVVFLWVCWRFGLLRRPLLVFAAIVAALLLHVFVGVVGLVLQCVIAIYLLIVWRLGV